ncbi:hypothetical protein, partial [Ideonella dechloratans]|uniref:hypothetical protein n=1 Tax=Ideonella dechloratans TaxID=36863 RepID=UPI001478E7E1
FLFPPLDDQGTVQRLFCPRDVYARFQLGESLGSMLVAEDTASLRIPRDGGHDSTLMADSVPP